MKGTNLGEFEELVLLAVGLLYADAYGLAIVEELKDQTKRKVTLSAVHKVLIRLEKKGYLKSHLGGATKERGGRNKKLYELTYLGKGAVNQTRELRNSMWKSIPEVVWNSKS
jgi:PadR family transcriptional regulator PadR